MNGNDNVFFDSNVLIYHLGGIPEAKLLIEKVENREIRGFINPIVASEVVYFYIKSVTGMKSYEIKRKPEVLSEINLEPIFELFSIFTVLEVNNQIVLNLRTFIEKYGLLPNDALIASTCEFYGIKRIATFDDDFKRVKTLEMVEEI